MATLVVMAAGMGSRFGGLKQIEPICDNGFGILDFSVYDAKKAGFNKIVFIIKEEMQDIFKEKIGNRISDIIDVEYVFQTMDNIPEGRKKPWGTGHAILCCKDVVKENFAVINADDYYGKNSYVDLFKFLSNAKNNEFAMVGFKLQNTLTENGTVSRGICEIENSYLKSVTERTKIADMKYTEDGTNWIELPDESIASMNLWGFTPAIFDELEIQFNEFLNTCDKLKDEIYLPFVVDKMLKEGRASVNVIITEDKWYGMTYKEDKEIISKALGKMVMEGEYN